ncbi:membrane protein insertase YidC [Horticoccus sp. 23ND18S-11]|uniref:membrane protein insertase YidC n=1 Tax=Horticoccus sp. 23ND18S-11 TaxID=3391832 RepID=UPI0039C9D27A
MDKKNTTIGVLLLLAAFALIYFSPRPVPPAPVPGGENAAPGVTATPGSTTTPGSTAPGAATSATTALANTAFAAINRDSAEATVTTLSNDFIEARFTDSGGALLEVAMKKYPAELKHPEPYVFNALHADPILAFVNAPGLDRTALYQRVSQTATEVVYRTVLGSGLEVTRRYVLSPNSGETTDPYQIRHETTFRNPGDQPTQAMPVTLALGTAAAPKDKADHHLLLKTSFSTNGDQHFIPRSDLEASSGFLGMGAHGSKPSIVSGGPLTWAAVKNKFFASIYTGDKPANSLITKRVNFSSSPSENNFDYGISAEVQVIVDAIAPKAESALTGTLYVGPKEYRRLANTKAFKADQDKIMDFGFFKYFSQILLTLMTWIHGWMVGISPLWAWGWAIVLTTLFLKIVFIPFTLAASKSAKRMAKIQPELQVIREKYKDNPQKQQQATMELFKTRKINPVGGCLPILLTMPFFMGFFTMLPSAAELRFQPFLWAPDLSSTDTVAILFGILPLNIMPLLMGATMVIQMHLTPSPSVDNAQMKMMKFMPYIFIIFCYTFSCALSLYSFVNGLFTIGQQLVINRMKDPEEKPAVAGPGGKVIKNVTPPKKK